MATVQFPFIIDRVTTATPAAYTDVIDDATFGKTQKELNEMFMAGASPLGATLDITANSGVTAANITAISNIEQPDAVIVKKSVNGGAEVLVQTGTTASITATSNIAGNTEKFSVTVNKQYKNPVTVEHTKYVCAVASSNTEAMTTSIFNNAKKYYTDDATFKAEVDTAYGDYIWVMLPSTISLESVKCAGIEVTFEAKANLSIGSGTYKGTYKTYKTIQKLANANWKLTLS